MNLLYLFLCMHAKLLQLCPTLCDPMDCSLPGSSFHGIFQARVLEWGAIAFSMTSLDRILKSRDITLWTKVYIGKAMDFLVVMYGCESWTIKKDECRRIDAFEVWTSLSVFTFMHWRRKWQPTPVFLPGESQGRGSLVRCCLWGRTESDTTEVT